MRPPRPEMSNSTAPPIMRERKPSGPVRAAGRLWFLSVLVGVVAIVISVLNRSTQLTYLQETAGGLDSGLDGSQLELVVRVAFWGTLGAFAVVLALEALFARFLLHGRGWARWVLLFLVVVNGGAALLATAFLGDDAATLQLVPGLVILQLVLAIAAVVASLLPAASRWFRAGTTPSSRKPA